MKRANKTAKSGCCSMLPYNKTVNFVKNTTLNRKEQKMKFLTRTIIVLAVFNLVTGNLAPGQNALEGKLSTYTISGSVGLSGVVMQGLPANPVTASDGTYKATVERGWSGTVAVVKEGYTFRPYSRTYSKVFSNYTNQNYTAEPITYTISGEVGVGGVEIQGLPGNTVTGRDGTYQANVKYGWRGSVRPTKEGYGFEPTNRPYSKVTHDQTNQNYSPRRVGPAPIFGRTGGRKVLVIPDTEVKPEELDAITQDLLVMSHILDERFMEPRTIKGVFADFGGFFGPNRRATEVVYLQGYGTLFLMEVNFAFSPPPKAQEKETKKTEEDVDQTWQRAKQKIFSPKDPMMGRRARSGQEYGIEQVEQLKTELIKTLKHTSNIRNLKPDEWLILTVIGQGRQGSGVYFRNGTSGSTAPRSSYSSYSSTSEQSSSSKRGGYGGMGYGDGYGGGMPGMMGGYSGGMGGYGTGGGMMGGMAYGEMASPSATVLTIRAKKSDVDAFAKGEIDFEQFQQKVQIFTY